MNGMLLAFASINPVVRVQIPGSSFNQIIRLILLLGTSVTIQITYPPKTPISIAFPR
jgi:hypothetical protein